MSYFKKFTDFAAGIGAFVAALFFVRRYMEFIPLTDEGAQGKLSQFLSPGADENNSLLIPIILVFLCSAVLGRVLKKSPYLCFAISLLPLAFTMLSVDLWLIHEQKMLFVAVSVLHSVGALVDCILLDRADGGHRLFISSKIASGFGTLVCGISVFLFSHQPVATEESPLNTVELEIIKRASPLNTEILLTLGIMLLAVFAIGLLLYNVYFIDALLSIIPFAYCVHAVFSENLSFLPQVFFALTCVCFLTNLLLAVFENNLSKAEQKAKKEARS